MTGESSNPNEEVFKRGLDELREMERQRHLPTRTPDVSVWEKDIGELTKTGLWDRRSLVEDRIEALSNELVALLNGFADTMKPREASSYLDQLAIILNAFIVNTKETRPLRAFLDQLREREGVDQKKVTRVEEILAESQHLESDWVILNGLLDAIKKKEGAAFLVSDPEGEAMKKRGEKPKPLTNEEAQTLLDAIKESPTDTDKD